KLASVGAHNAYLCGFDGFVNSMFLFGYDRLPPNLFLHKKTRDTVPRTKSRSRSCTAFIDRGCLHGAG
ncbi:MAG: hypothetical protein IJC61_03725, partial [Oscillospiraceae bacterium]|nr:hypothetical protein [Oscillospiraceae bacterium]